MENESKIPVLVVDDELIVRFIAAEGLQDAGYEVLEAGCASEALELLNSRADVGVLFTDVNMPGEMDGLQLAEVVHAQWPAIKLVVTSGRGIQRRVPDDGRFLPKPYTAEQLNASIRRARGL